VTKVFVGGSRRVVRLNPEVGLRLDAILAKQASILVGDANGADKAVQNFLRTREYRDVEVFCSGDECRNNVGNWTLRHVAVESRKRDFDFYAAKDQQMSREADSGLMIWDGKSVGTLMNAIRLIRQGKEVSIFETQRARFREMQSESEWNDFFSGCSEELRSRIAKLSASDSEIAAPVQASLL
jgi:adenine-specific DNA-methyltransferase